MSDQTYEGWSNRETWCANLWLANDEGLYETVREWAGIALDDADSSENIGDDRVASARYHLAETLKDWFEELAHGDGEDSYVPAPGVYQMLADIGSLYRVDWHEVAESWITTALEERAYGD